jgi:hypothetical protein
MKAISVLASLMFLLLVEKNIAQTNSVTSGVYLTADDYKKNKLIEEAECTNDKEKFERHDVFSRPSFVVIIKGKKITFLKKDIYAYRDCDNKVWRFYNNQEYEILETKDIYIYSIRKVVLNGMTVEKDPVYYFSVGVNGEVKELNVDNLKSAYANNEVFRNMLVAEFNSNTEAGNSDKAVHSYDFAHKMYKVNYLLRQSIK